MAGFSRCLGHFLRLSEIHGQRLLAQHMLAGRECVQGHAMVQVVRSGDDDAIDRRVLENVLVVRGRGGDAESPCRCLGRVVRCITRSGYFDIWTTLKTWNVDEAADESGSDDADAQVGVGVHGSLLRLHF